jgi:hypothetical protein
LAVIYLGSRPRSIFITLKWVALKSDFTFLKASQGREMGFSDHDDAGDAVRLEVVEDGVYDGGVGRARGLQHDVLHVRHGREGGLIAAVKFEYKVLAECFHHFFPVNKFILFAPMCQPR